MSRLLCRLRLHRWNVIRLHSIRYGVLVAKRCRRCGAEQQEAKW